MDAVGRVATFESSCALTVRECMNVRSVWIAVIVIAASAGVQAQWVHHPTRGTPRAKDGKPILTARAPRTATGRPDLYGIWQAEPSPFPELARLLPNGENGLGEDVPSKYFVNILADFPVEEAPLQPAAAAAA